MKQYLEELYANNDVEALKTEYRWMRDHYYSVREELQSTQDLTKHEVEKLLFTRDEIYEYCGEIQKLIYGLGLEIDEHLLLMNDI